MNTGKTGGLGFLLAIVLALVAVAAPATASAKDSNRDRIPDRWEKRHKLSLKKDQRKLDQDRDGLKNRGEWKAGTNPRDKDSDEDGTPDGRENAGVIASYDAETQALTITLYGGGEIAGSVTDQTRVECDSGAEDPGSEIPEGPAPDPSATHGGPGGGYSGGDESGDEDESGSEDEWGDHQGWGHGPGGHGGCNGDCSLEDLAEGVEILEANVKYTADGAVFTEIEIDQVEAES